MNGVAPLLSAIVVCPLACAIITTKSPTVAPVGAETERAVPDGSSFLDEDLTAIAIFYALVNRIMQPINCASIAIVSLESPTTRKIRRWTSSDAAAPVIVMAPVTGETYRSVVVPPVSGTLTAVPRT